MSALCALALAAATAAPAAADPAGYGLATAEVSLTTTQAGAPPDLTMDLEWRQDPASPLDSNGQRFPYARTRDLTVALPPGLLGNPSGVPRCTPAQLLASSPAVSDHGDPCPRDSQVGTVLISIYDFGSFLEPIYAMPSPGGDVVARLGFVGLAFPVYIDVGVRSDSDYGLTARVVGAPSAAPLVRAKATIWGVPADPSHDRQRILPTETKSGVTEFPPHPSGLLPTPFLTNPTRCGVPQRVVFEVASYQLPAQTSTTVVPLPQTVGCSLLPFAPALAATPTNPTAAAPTGLDVALDVPQHEAVGQLATAHLRDATVALPSGMALSPAAADGLQACSAEQVGFGGLVPAACPPGSKVGDIEFDVPSLDRPLEGAVYLRTPEPGNLFRIWLVADDLGAHVRVPGEIHADPATGQLTASFLDAPQVPLRGLDLRLREGPRGVLANPSACGTYRTRYDFTPWSGGAAVGGYGPMTIDRGCGAGGFAPRLEAGTVDPAAGRPSPFVLTLTREDGEQNVARVDLALPPGLLAKLAGVPLCPPGDAASGSCPPTSRVGTATVALGPGSTPLWVPQPGREPTAAYLSGPYRGAPFGLVVRVPAQAGPFDLGTQVVRAGIDVDPETAQVTVRSDPLPQILAGVPIPYRTIHVDVGRPGFTLNPTSCAPMAVRAAIASASGAVANPSTRFQAAGCRGLGFAPRLRIGLDGGTRRGAHPRLRAVLTPRPGDANIAAAAVALPHSEFLDQAHVRTICTGPQFAADRCPASSVYGRAKAIVPLLDQPLEGPVYLRSSDHRLPDLVARLRGQVEIELVGRIDTFRGGIRTSFDTAPDAPVRRFVLEMQGGKRGLLVNSTDLCRGSHRATVELEGHNGKVHDLTIPLRSDC